MPISNNVVQLTDAAGRAKPTPQPNLKRPVSFPDFVRRTIIAEGIHEGTWSLYVNFGMRAVNLPVGDADQPTSHLPAAIIPLLEVGIEPCAPEWPDAVDAAVVNPKS